MKAAPSSAPALFVPPAVLDIEASGFGRHSYPIEVGYVLADGRSDCMLIRPAPGWTHWDEAAERVHGVPRSLLLARGCDVAEVAGRLNDRLHGLTVYCDGWAHDYSWLGALYEAADRAPAFRLDNLRVLLTDQQAARWAVARHEVAAEMRLQRHRASADARVLQSTVTRLRQATNGG